MISLSRLPFFWYARIKHALFYVFFSIITVVFKLCSGVSDKDCAVVTLPT